MLWIIDNTHLKKKSGLLMVFFKLRVIKPIAGEADPIVIYHQEVLFYCEYLGITYISYEEIGLHR